jgi:hypothetical protein
MVRPPGVGAFQFVILSSLRAVQLTRGCRPRIDGIHKHTVTAQLEISQGKIVQEPAPSPPVSAAAIVVVG